MKNSIKKIISIIMCAVMLFAMGAIASSAASYANPVFEVAVLSESSSEVTVSLNLVSGKFNCADFAFVAGSGYTCKNIKMGESLSNADSMGQSNVNNGKVSVLCTSLYSQTGSFYTATFIKTGSSSFKSGDVKVVFSNCSVLEDGDTIVLYPTVTYEVEISLDKTDVSMNYKDSTGIGYSTNASAGCTVVWSTSDDDVATVDENGEVYAAGKGEATITCSVVDAAGNVLAEDTCDVTVEYSFGQWLIIILLFGFIWYI